MPDVFTKAKRSEVMSRIRSAGDRAGDFEFWILDAEWNREFCPR